MVLRKPATLGKELLIFPFVCLEAGDGLHSAFKIALKPLYSSIKEHQSKQKGPVRIDFLPVVSVTVQVVLHPMHGCKNVLWLCLHTPVICPIPRNSKTEHS